MMFPERDLTPLLLLPLLPPCSGSSGSQDSQGLSQCTHTAMAVASPLFYPGSMLLLHSSCPRILASLMVSEWSDASQSLRNEVSTPVLGVGGSGKG